MAKRVTASEVAKALGISTMTVSRALNNRPNVDAETRERVRETAKQLGYIPNHIAKSLVLKRTNTIGVVVPEITHSFFPEVVRGIEEVSHKAGFQIILSHSAENASREQDAIQTLASKQVDGILISTAQTVRDFDFYTQVMEMGLPLVFYDRCVKGIGASCVSIDDEDSAALITEHLLMHGHEPIAHLSGPQTVLIGNSRLQGFRKAHAKFNKEVHEELIVESGFHEEGGYEAMNMILDKFKARLPRAVVAVNDPAAFGAMKAIQDRSLSIPEDIAMAGFSDDIRAELMKTPLTTIRQNAYEVGKRAAKKLLDLVMGKTTTVEDIVVKGELVIRKSCGCSD